MMLSLLFQLEQTQWLSQETLRQHQFDQLTLLVEFLHANSPYYRERFLQAGWRPARNIEGSTWSRLSCLTRRDLQSQPKAIAVSRPPASHGRTMAYSTTGSLGTPVQGYGNELTHLYGSALTMRNHLWHRRNLSGKFAAIRTKVEGGRFPNWGIVESAAFRTGPGVLLDIRTDVGTQLAWLASERPNYLLTHPSNLRAMLLLARDRSCSLPDLLEVATFGEMLPSDLRDLAHDIWGVPLVDIYSAEEVGLIALQCPECPDVYHVQSENLLVEIVDDEGNECRPGEIGRVLVSTLHNFTMPLLRYEIGDYAEAGAPCSCGRGLPTIQRIVGRQRNMLRRPDGRSHWPSFPYEELAPIIKFQQIKIVQHQPADLEVHLVCSERPDAAHEQIFSEKLCDLLRGEFNIQYTYHAAPIVGNGGKFEDFVSHCD